MPVHLLQTLINDAIVKQTSALRYDSCETEVVYSLETMSMDCTISYYVNMCNYGIFLRTKASLEV